MPCDIPFHELHRAAQDHCYTPSPHTTHALQPCNVGVFGPLANGWKLIVTRLSMENLLIRKSNFLRYYHKACEKALTEVNIWSAWNNRNSPIQPENYPSISIFSSA
ncbi:hypothetical protein PM082_004272 [Marasmius tenuissimus]|nr:hypothetical protein PM082_004272 [Marasmius tenuissimus]